jgi:hypothetical protein
MHTKKKHLKKGKKKHRKSYHKKRGGKKAQFDNFENVGKSVDDFLNLFNMDELAKKNAEDYLGYKTYNRNNMFTFTLLPSLIKDNQYSGVRITKNAKHDPGIHMFDKINYDLDGVEEGLGELALNMYNITNKTQRKGIYNKNINFKETLKDNLPAVEEENIERFVDKRF